MTTAPGDNPSGVASASLQNNERDSEFISVSGLAIAGLRATDAPITFYRRPAVGALINFVSTALTEKHFGQIDGLPGTGKSSILWHALVSLAVNKERQAEANSIKVMWVHLNRYGNVSAVANIDSKGFRSAKMPPVKYGKEDEVIPALMELSNDYNVFVLDGSNAETIRSHIAMLTHWRTNISETRTAFLTMSNKVERLHSHELDTPQANFVRYLTQHSWTFEEFIAGFVNKENGTRSKLFLDNIDIFKRDWDVEEDDENVEKQRCGKRNRSGCRKLASVTEIVSQKFAFSGGSARWMLQQTKADIETEIKRFLAAANDVTPILNLQLGPKSSMAKTHLYFSQPSIEDPEITVYSIVSERATQLLINKAGEKGIMLLYSHAAILNNPAFLGWVIEADYFNRCNNNTLSLHVRNSGPVDIHCPQPVVEFDCARLKWILSESDEDAMCAAVTHLLPSPGSSKICKPISWNQGGYDVVWIEAHSTETGKFHLRFGQVIKSASHTLKLQFFHEFVSFLKLARGEILSLEIGFIVPCEAMERFRVTHSQVYGAGLLTNLPLYKSTFGGTWIRGKEETLVDVFGLDIPGTVH